MKKIIFLIALALPFLSNAQIITTIAGTGTSGATGDGGAATAATLARPTDVATDTFGNVFIADNVNSVIRKVNISGVITVIAGYYLAGYFGDGGPATSALLGIVTGVAVDVSGNIYIADAYNDRIRKVNTTGIITTIAGNGTAGYTGDGVAATTSELNMPYQVAVDVYGNVYIADAGNNRIRMINTAGIITTIAGTGVAGFSGDGGAATAAKLNQPYGIAVDGAGNVFIGDNGNNRIRKINAAGAMTTIAGNGTSGYSGDGLPATDANISAMGIGVDIFGNIYIADDFSNRVRKVSASGIISTIAGDGTGGFTGDGMPATSGELFGPTGVAADKKGNVYIADQVNERIRKVNQASAAVSPVTAIAEDLTVYPNPAKNIITISAPDMITSVAICDLLGKTFYEHKYNARQVDVNTSTLANGIYLLKINNTTVRKFVKQ